MGKWWVAASALLVPVLTVPPAYGQGFELLLGVPTGVRATSISEVSDGGGVVCGGKIFFVGYDHRGDELWVSDGTVAGTRCVKDLRPGQASSAPHHLLCYRNAVWFIACGSLWKSDGTEAGTVRVHEAYFATAPVVGSDGVYFSVCDPVIGVWKTDGTPAGTTQVAETAKIPVGLIPYGKEIVFFDNANDAMWITNKGEVTCLGSCKTRRQQTDRGRLNTMYHNELYLAAEGDGGGYELWRTNGTAEGTRLVKDLNRGAQSSDPEWLCVWQERLYFVAHVADERGDFGRELCRSDGTDTGTGVVVDLSPDLGASTAPGHLYPLPHGLMFEAFHKPYLTDGTAAGTVPLNLPARTNPLWSYGFLPSNGVDLFLVSSGYEYSPALWMTDGTLAGTRFYLTVSDAHPVRRPNRRSVHDKVPGLLGQRGQLFWYGNKLGFFTPHSLWVQH